MKKFGIILGFVLFGLSAHAQNNESKAFYSPGVIRIEMEKAGMKLSHQQFMKLQKTHQEYQSKINESKSAGNMTEATRFEQSYTAELATIFNAKQMEKFTKMQREGSNKKLE